MIRKYVILLLVLSCFAGCGKPDDPEPVPETEHSLEVSVQQLDIAGESAEYGFDIQTTDGFVVLCEADWIDFAPVMGSNGRYHQSFSAGQNTTDEVRSAIITVATNYKNLEIHVEQGTYTILCIFSKAFIVDTEESEIYVYLRGPETIECRASVDWITLAEKNAEEGVFRFNIATNGTYDNRTGLIYFSCEQGNQKDTVTVSQFQKDAIILSAKEEKLDLEGGVIDIVLRSNIEYETLITEPDWIRRIETKALTEDRYSFQIDRNPSRFDRDAEIQFFNYEYLMSDKLQVLQTGYESILGIRYDGLLFSGLTLDGTNVYGTIDWGDNTKEDYSNTQILHSYNSSTARSIVIKTHNSREFVLDNIVGVEEIDLSKY